MSPDQVLPIVLITVMSIVAVVLIVVGIQLFLLLKETRLTMKSVDGLVKNTNHKLDLLVNPLRTLGSLASGVAGGMKAFEAFSVWLKQRKK
jgi:hypothetical protein